MVGHPSAWGCSNRLCAYGACSRANQALAEGLSYPTCGAASSYVQPTTNHDHITVCTVKYAKPMASRVCFHIASRRLHTQATTTMPVGRPGKYRDRYGWAATSANQRHMRVLKSCAWTVSLSRCSSALTPCHVHDALCAHRMLCMLQGVPSVASRCKALPVMPSHVDARGWQRFYEEFACQ